MQAAKTKAPQSSVSHGDSIARSQSGVLHSSKHLSSVQTICVLFQSCQLVWMGPMDMLELGKFAPKEQESFPNRKWYLKQKEFFCQGFFEVRGIPSTCTASWPTGLEVLPGWPKVSMHMYSLTMIIAIS